MSKNILLVEDDFFIRDVYTIVLTKEEYLVDTAEDGEQGILKAHEKQYDLILLDIMLPKASGVEVLRAIRSKEDSKSHASPVIAVTNMGQEDIIETMLSLGAAKYIFKSAVTNQELIKEVNTFFEAQQEQI
jgi:DNA-binding response OmpR family regulator